VLFSFEGASVVVFGVQLLRAASAARAIGRMGGFFSKFAADRFKSRCYSYLAEVHSTQFITG
jgi:hypothetical protein